ncbi:hypothetical protein L9F63_017271 [Diploptera punctata]|uniref:Uncharacterized protein n=1 Tax=Diploptera punctata TaxID=6984 RepID=A0AAD7ZZB6_DIPPU|nr:hypothetical protein L9F63_017271 [Diploptera punctata]
MCCNITNYDETDQDINKEEQVTDKCLEAAEEKINREPLVTSILQDHARLLNRVRRDDASTAQEIKEQFMMCCKEPEEKGSKNAMSDEDKEKCTQYVTDKVKDVERDDLMMNVYMCSFQCVYMQRKMADENGNITEEIKNLKFFGSEGIALEEKAKTICPARVTELLKDEEEGKYLCNSQAHLYITCVANVTIWYCPDDLKIQDDRCNTTRELLRSTFEE